MSQAENYDHQAIEGKWQARWEHDKIYQALDGDPREKKYLLVEFPYPSGEGLHTGHVRSYTALDLIARKWRMEGKNVLYPMGWDAFGLPTENYAIKTGLKPQAITKTNTDNYRRQLQSLGLSFDWSREINTTDPAYYHWTQWIFLRFYKAGLAYKAKALINWCPKDKIGLANEEVVAGKCERCGTAVEPREKEQWMLAITKYADRLDKDLDTVDFLPQIKTQQRNWIGRNEGVEIEFKISLTPNPLPKGEGENAGPSPLGREGWGYQTADPKTYRLLEEKALEMRQNQTEAESTIWRLLKNDLTGEHFRRQHIVGKFIVDFVCLEKRLVVEVDGDIHDYQKEADRERTNFLEQSGFTVIRFNNGEVLKNSKNVIEKIVAALKTLPLGEGLGEAIEVFTTRPDTIFGVTFIAISTAVAKNNFGIDQTFPETTEKLGVNTGLRAINPANGEEVPVWVTNYVLNDVGTGAIMGVPAHDERDLAFAKKYQLPISAAALVDPDKIIEQVGGQKIICYKLRDWVFSRQRYWGEPIPMIWCEKCGWQAVPEKDLPVTLPPVEKYQPTETGESPLAAIEDWVKTVCPKCGGPARRETDTMPNWAGSSWYYLRYCDPDNKQELAAPDKLKYWTPVDWYNGGMEHTTLHLLYSRFWHKFLFDQGLVPTTEPYQKRTSHGLILAEGGVKMSKSRGNVVNPDSIVATYGADTLRLYEMFLGPFDQAVVWSTESIIGPRRFLERVWRLAEKVSASHSNSHFALLLNQTIKKVSQDIEAMSFNTAVAALMVLASGLEKEETVSQTDWEIFLKLLAPFAPHLTEELWSRLGHQRSIHLEAWPQADAASLAAKTAKLIIQVNGVVRDTAEVATGLSEAAAKELVLVRPKIVKWLDGQTPRKVVYLPDRLINFVV